MGALRLILALGVMFWHVGRNRMPLQILDGGICVLIFFIISGFYMSMILHEKYSKLPGGRWRFFVNRFLRIFPIYFVVLILQHIDYRMFGVPTIFSDSMGVPWYTRLLLIFMNIFKFGQDYWQTLVESQTWPDGAPTGAYLVGSSILGKAAFNGSPGFILIGQGWSLASELTFYLLAPLILLRNRKWFVGALATSLLVRLLMYFYFGPTVFMGSLRTKFFPGIVVFFFLGHLSYLIYRTIEKRPLSATLSRPVAVFVFGLFAWGFVFKGGLLMNAVEYDSTTAWAFYALITMSIPFLFLVSRRSTIDRYIGLYSYPVYLLHPLAIETATRHTGTVWAETLLALALTFLASTLLIVLVETPINRLRERVTMVARLKAA